MRYIIILIILFGLIFGFKAVDSITKVSTKQAETLEAVYNW